MNNTEPLELIRKLEKRIEELEHRVDEIEKSAKPLQDEMNRPLESKPKFNDAQHESPITITMLRKSFHQANYDAGDAGDRIDFVFRFTNHLTKDVRAFLGQVIFTDLFDRLIMKLSLSDEGGLLVGKSKEWKGGVEYNQFTSEHQRLLSMSDKDLTVTFELEQVIYSDGSKGNLAHN